MLIFPTEEAFDVKALIDSEEQAYRDQIDLAVKSILDTKIRFIFLAGPSCSGKSTTARCLVNALEKNGKRVFACSTDDFFRD